MKNKSQSEHFYKVLLDTARAGVIISDVLCDEKGQPFDYRCLEINSTFEEFTKLSAEEIIGRTMKEILPEEIAEYWLERFQEAVTKDKPVKFEKHSEFLNKWIEVTVCVPEKGKLACLFYDVTDRKQSEQELVRVTTVVEQMYEVVIITDIEGKIEYVNPAFEKITGYSRSEAKGRHITMLESKRHEHEYLEDLWKCIQSGNIWKGRLIDRRKDGIPCEMEVVISPIWDKDANITGYVSVQKDITHEIELERKLSQIQKMQALGTLVGGIAHDFNNILMGISGYTSMGISESQKDSPARLYFEQVHKAGQRASELVKQILTFSRRTKKKQEPLQIALIIKEAMKLLEATLPSSIEIRQNIKSKRYVNSDPTEIHQIIMNLCVNASNSMRENGGEMIIDILDFELEEENAGNFTSIKPGKYIKLSVSDTGCGIDSSIMGKIFEPFFTTKVTGEATGMGLSVVYGIVKDLKGEITVESAPGKGSVFSVYFPIVTEEAQTLARETQAKRIKKGNGELIMFVDDELLLTKMMTRMLESLNYRVKAFNKSPEAFEAFASSPESFDLIITDQTMPNLSGIRLARKMRDIAPEIPIMICTGYGDIISQEMLDLAGVSDIIIKPATIEEISEILSKFFG